MINFVNPPLPIAQINNRLIVLKQNNKKKRTNFKTPPPPPPIQFLLCGRQKRMIPMFGHKNFKINFFYLLYISLSKFLSLVN